MGSMDGGKKTRAYELAEAELQGQYWDETGYDDVNQLRVKTPPYMAYSTAHGREETLGISMTPSYAHY